MNKSNINELSAQTEADSSTTAQNQHVSQPNANTNVVGSLVGRREIKFRAFIKSINHLIDIAGFEFRQGKFITLFYEGGFRVETVDNVQLIQYTGLKDKNGKEIYEGDILNGRNRVLKIVYRCDKRAAFCESEQFKPIPAKHSFAKLYDKFGKVFNKNGILENHFIVGNIFETPELLETLR
jgi:uncharacterized phage protein (TIGR01671 family)